MNEKLTPTRRDFLKTAFAASIIATGGTTIIAKILPDFKEINGDILGIYTVNFATDTKLAALKTLGGSVVITIPGASGNARKMVLTRSAADTFIAVSAICTHTGCTVNPYNTQLQRIVCDCHDSQFAIDGKVLKGPASTSLQKFTTTFSGGETVGIEVPGLVGIDDELQNRFSLENSPNPAADQTVIRFVLPKETDVVLKVMTTQGQEIATLLEGKLSAGSHSIPFKMNNLASGVYFYQLTAGQYSQTKQLTVAR